jgi:hypothetical protein
MTNYLYEIKAVVQLNNSAVSLLSSQCFSPAMETFCDAIAVLKTACSMTDHPALFPCNHAPIVELSAFPNDSTHKRLQRAAKRLSNPAFSPIAMGTNILVTVVSDNEGPPVIARWLANPSRYERSGQSHPVKVQLIRMEPADFEAPCPDDLPIEAAILLYNYGMAYRCLSSLSTSVPYSKELNLGAISLLRLSNTALRSWNFVTSSCSQNRRYFLVEILSLLHLTILSNELRLERDCNHYLQLFNDLVPSLLSLRAFEDEFTSIASPAA